MSIRRGKPQLARVTTVNGQVSKITFSSSFHPNVNSLNYNLLPDHLTASYEVSRPIFYLLPR